MIVCSVDCTSLFLITCHCYLKTSFTTRAVSEAVFEMVLEDKQKTGKRKQSPPTQKKKKQNKKKNRQAGQI